MDVINRSYAPSLRKSSSKSLFDMNMCDKKIDYILIGLVSLSIIWILYYHCNCSHSRKKDDDSNK